MDHVKSDMMVNALKSGITAFGYEKLGIQKEEHGRHLIGTGARMVMYLGECPVYRIMMIGQ